MGIVSVFEVRPKMVGWCVDNFDKVLVRYMDTSSC